MRPGAIYETVLYADDLAEAGAFYRDVLGLRLVKPMSELAAAFRLDDGRMLLVFDRERPRAPGREVPSHGTTGPGHIAFRVEESSLGAWRDRLAGCGVAIEKEITWETGARSIYCRDPSGNSVELAAGEIWPA